MADDPAVCTRFKNCSSDVLNARGCEDVYNNELPKGWCHCLRPEDNVTGNLARQLRRQQPVVRMHTPTDGAPSASGGLAIILRGGAFRGSRDDDANTRHTAQMEASRSLYRHAIKPFIALGQRVRVYLTLYSDVDSSLLRDLYSPYKRHVAGITRLHVNASQQLTMNANALGTFLQLVEAQQERFDVVVMTRFDLYFKMDFPKLLGTPDLRNFSGVSILWRELEEGSKWRILWTPTKHELESTTIEGRAHMLRTAVKMERTRNSTMTPRHWMAGIRTADTFHAIGFPFVRCFRMAVLQEMTRGWTSHFDRVRAAIDWEHRGQTAVQMYASRGSKEPPIVNDTLARDPKHGYGLPVTTAEEDEALVKGTLPLPPDGPTDTSHYSTPASLHIAKTTSHMSHHVMNHWMHKLRYHLARALGPKIGRLTPYPYDSNPCASTCMLNPIYDIVPRLSWVIESGICQAQEDFVYDPVSNTMCCPSPDYCCPNSVVDCTDPRAVLFDVDKANGGKGVPDEIIANGWRRHFLARTSVMAMAELPVPNDISSMVCPASEWNGGLKGRHGCSLAMTDASVEKVKRLWQAAAPWKGLNGEPRPVDDDVIG